MSKLNIFINGVQKDVPRYEGELYSEMRFSCHRTGWYKDENDSWVHYTEVLGGECKNTSPFTWHRKVVEFNCRECGYPLEMKTFTNGIRKDIFDIEPCAYCLGASRDK